MLYALLIFMLLNTGLLILTALAAGRLLLNQEFERQQRSVLDAAHEDALLMISDSLSEMSTSLGVLEVNQDVLFAKAFPENEGAESTPAQSS